MKTDINQRLTAQQIAKRVKMVKQMQKLGNPKFSEYSDVVYDDGVWSITLEMYAISGVIRWWVAREDAYGHYNNSLFTMHKLGNGQIGYSVSYQVKKDIVTRLLTVYKILEKEGIEA